MTCAELIGTRRGDFIVERSFPGESFSDPKSTEVESIFCWEIDFFFRPLNNYPEPDPLPLN